MTKIISRRRGVSEIIGALLLLGVTAAGAFLISGFLKSSDIGAVNQNPEFDSGYQSIVLLGYDTRDSVRLSGIMGLDNTSPTDKILCTTSCSGAASDDQPGAGGTEYIVLTIRNKNLDSVWLKGISINNERHDWDLDTSNVNLSFGGSCDGTGICPSAGLYSLLPTSNAGPIKQKPTTEIQGDEEVRVLIKLSEDISSDIDISDSLQVFLNVGDSNLAKFIIIGGDAK